jgi:hypothetical protein
MAESELVARYLEARRRYLAARRTMQDSSIWVDTPRGRKLLPEFGAWVAAVDAEEAMWRALDALRSAGLPVPEDEPSTEGHTDRGGKTPAIPGPNVPEHGGAEGQSTSEGGAH